jgi:outer membrane protein TolC
MHSNPTHRIALRLGVLVASFATACLHVPPAPLAPAQDAERIEARSLADPALRDFLSEQLGQAIEPWPRPSWTVEDLTLAAIFFNPALRVARAGADVAHAHEKTAAQRPNPSLMVQPLYYQNNLASGAPPWISMFNLNWTIETGGKRTARMAVAEANARVADEATLSAAWLIRGEVTQAAIALRAAMARRDQHARIDALLAERATLLDHRLAHGAATQTDLALARQARLHAEMLAATSERLVAEARARLAAALGLPRRALEDLSLGVDLDAEPESWTRAATLDASTARSAAMLGRSDVKAGLADYDATEANLRLQLAQQYPNLLFGPSYKYDQGGHRYGFTLTLDLPLLSRNEGGIEEAAAARAQSAARFDALQTKVLAEVDAASAALEGARGERSNADAMLRGTDREAALAARALAAGATDRPTWLAAEILREESRLLAVDADEHWKLALARLELAVRPVGPLDTTLGARAAP